MLASFRLDLPLHIGGVIVDWAARPPPEGSTSQIHLVRAKRVFRRYLRRLRVPK